jgi:hypothetical protein
VVGSKNVIVCQNITILNITSTFTKGKKERKKERSTFNVLSDFPGKKYIFCCQDNLKRAVHFP